MASATRAPTPWTEISRRNQSRSAAVVKPTSRIEILGDQHFGVEHDLLADRAQRRQRAARGGDEIADAVDVDHREIGAEAVQAAQPGDHGERYRR